MTKKPNFLSRLIDGAVGIFSPGAALRRQFYRERLLTQKRTAQYAAAKTSRLTGTWSPADSSVNDIIRASSPAVRARVRQLVRDFPIFSRAVQVLIDKAIGPGLVFQSRATTADGQSIDEDLASAIESAFNFWADQCDIAGQLHFYEFMELAKRQEFENGEFLIVKRRSRSQKRYLPFAIQLVESDWLTGTPNYKIPSNSIVDQGVEYNRQTGERVAYHFTDPDGWGKSVRVPANQIIHGFHTLRPGQLRGISSFAPGVLLAHDLSEYLDAEIDTAKLAAKYLAFVKRNDPASRTSLLEEGTGEDQGKKIDEMENAIIEYLATGEDITIAHNPKPGSNFPPTVKLMLRMFSATTNVPYELLSFDYEGLSYSSSRISRSDFNNFLRPIIDRHVRRFCNPIFYPFMESAIMREKIPVPAQGFFNNPARFLAAEWQPPGVDYVDPLRESKAHISEKDALLRSPQEIARARGRDYATIVKELKQAKKLIEDAGLEIISASTAVGNNPAAIEGQKAEQIKLAIRNAGINADIEAMLFELIDKLDQTLH